MSHAAIAYCWKAGVVMEANLVSDTSPSKQYADFE